MTTKFLGVKEFRQNIAKYSQEAKRKNIRYIILRKNIPILEVLPLDEKKFAWERLAQEIQEAEEGIKKGETYTHEEVLAELGLK